MREKNLKRKPAAKNRRIGMQIRVYITDQNRAGIPSHIKLERGEDDRWFFGLRNNQIDPKIADIVDEISVQEFFRADRGSRETGIYKLGSAQAELEGPNSQNLYVVNISAKNLSDTRKLLHAIKAGTTRPDISFEGPQSGMSRAELEAELEKVQAKLDHVQARNERLVAELSECEKRRENDQDEIKKAEQRETNLRTRISLLTGKVAGGGRFQSRKKLQDELNNILDPANKDKPVQ